MGHCHAEKEEGREELEKGCALAGGGETAGWVTETERSDRKGSRWVEGGAEDREKKKMKIEDEEERVTTEKWEVRSEKKKKNGCRVSAEERNREWDLGFSC